MSPDVLNYVQAWRA